MTAAQTEILSDQRGYRKTAGERLRRARELKGLSQKDVANALNLMVSHVRAIESNRYDAQAEGEHFGGYLRSYARLVDLDPQQIIDLYTSQSDDSGADTVVLSPVQLAQQQQSRFKPGISIGFFAVVCLAVAVWVASRFGVFGGGEEPPELTVAQQEDAVAAKQQSATPAQDTDGPDRKSLPALRKPPAILERPAIRDEIAESASSAEISAPVAPGKQERDATAAGSVIRNTKTAEPAIASNQRRNSVEDALPARPSPAAAARQRREKLAAQAAAERAANASQATLSNIDIQQRATRTNRQSSRRVDREADRRVQPSTLDNNVASASGSDQLVLDFTTDCWVEVYDATGEALRLGVERAGDTLMLRGKAPFDVLVGFSRGVTMMLNGEPVPIKQHQFSDSTQLVVGGPDDYFGTQQTYEDTTATVAVNGSADDELDYTIEDTIDDQLNDEQASGTQAADEELVDKAIRDDDGQTVAAASGQTTAAAAAGNRVNVPARYSRQYATPAPSTVDELEMAARQINTSRDDASNAYNAEDVRRSDKTSLIGKQDELQFSFSAECWLEVYDVEKRPLVMDTKYAGETLELKGHGPFEVRVGNSRAVTLKVNGQKIEIKRDRYIGSTEFFVGSR
ncbi:MAG: RodZ domain-containing protein [Pseudomonadales bacterium]